MTIALGILLEAIRKTSNQSDLHSQIAPKIGEYFAATRWAIFFFNPLPFREHTLQKILNLALSTEHNPIARYIAERHAPVHEGIITTPAAWSLICPRPDHWHVMAGPVIDRNQIIGAVCCTRTKSMPGFNHENLIDLSAICLHVSICCTAIGTQAEFAARPLRQESSPLTPRERQIAELVALGKTNAEIGRQLWITENSVKQALKRMFRKLDVSSRAAMVAKLLAPVSPVPTYEAPTYEAFN